MQDITQLPLTAKEEIAGYIKQDTLEKVNSMVQEPKVKDTFYTRYGKRVIDFVIGLLGFIITLPFNFIIGIITFFDVGRPIIFKQTRIGLNGKKFTLYKFRNMTNDTDANGELLPPEQRVTKWGKFVRKTSLDELLNFFSILKGDMSVIGPRPVKDYYYSRVNNRHKAMYSVRPGLECPTPHKVNHVLSWQERLDNYVWYAENCSFYVDFKLAFRIIAVTFDRRSATQRSSAGNGGFLGYDLEGNVIYTKSVPDKYVEEYLKAHGYRNLDEAIEARKKDAKQPA